MSKRQQSQTHKLLKNVLTHMHTMAHGDSVGSILLAGDPGVGKTTFVKILGSLLGLKTVIIEIPHITEEHLINIPFIVYNPKTDSTTGQTSKEAPLDYDLKLAQSNLYSHLIAAKAMTDSEYLAHMKSEKTSAVIKEMFKQLGGTEDKIPDDIKTVRSKYKTILFLDEYFRQTTPRVRNLLRTILNKKIGMHELPDSVYVMYASNMRDAGLEELHSNTQFSTIRYKTPAISDWFDWLVNAFKEHSRVKLNEKVLAKFKEILKDEDLSHTDVAKEVRTSPRRWEQLLLYINSSIPVADEQEARALLTNVKNNFIHYQTEEHSELYDKVLSAVTELIKDTSRLNVSKTNTLDPSEWRTALDHAIVQQMKLGDARKYIPVVSGLPGIGKTTEALKVAAKHNLRLINIDVSELSAEDVMGMPMPGKKKDEERDEIKVRFSMPALYQRIMSQIKASEREYFKALREEYGDKAEKHIEDYKKQEWKYLIFLDELNRADEKTFNSLRRIILEKDFGPADEDDEKTIKLPEGSIVVGAINPVGGGTSELTQHFRDVIDIIPARSSWSQTKKYLRDKKIANVDEKIKDVSLNILDEFVKKFQDRTGKKNPETAAFYLNPGQEMYISPREYSDMMVMLASRLQREISAARRDPDIDESEMREIADDTVADALEDSLNHIFAKHDIENDEFLNTLKLWVRKLDDEVYGGMLSKKVSQRNTLGGLLLPYLEGSESLTDMPENVNIININNSINHAQFIEQIRNTLLEKIKDDETFKHYVLDEKYPKITLEGEDTLKKSTEEKTTLLTNFFTALLYTLHIHQYQRDRVQSAAKALTDAMRAVITSLSGAGKIDDDTKSAAIEAVADLRANLADVIQSL